MALVLAVAAAPATAREPLKLKDGKVWKHKHSGIVVPAALGGIARTGGVMFVADDLDVSVAFDTEGTAEALTVYIFRNTNGAVPVWFAQAQWGIENRPVYGKPTLHLAPQPFVPAGQSSASGLKAVYAPQGGPYRSTGVMLLPVGEWYVKLRASSQSRTPDELAAWMDAAMGEVAWPKNIAAAPVAAPVTACPAPLTFPVAAQDAPKNGGADLMTGLLGLMVADGTAKQTTEAQAAEATVRWCRDAQLAGNQAAYRRNEAADSYLLAVGDNGNGIWVEPDAAATILDSAETNKGNDKAPTRFAILLSMAAQRISFVAQDRLPSPERVIEIVNAGRSVTTVPTWGKKNNVQINSNSF